MPGAHSSLPQVATTSSLQYSGGGFAVWFFFYNLLRYYFITFQVTGSRIDFVSLLAGRTWSAFVIESDFI